MTIDRTALRLLCEAATPGPWEWDTEQNLVSLGKPGEGKPSLVAYGEPTYEGNHCVCGDEDDLAFIAASRAAVPDLLDELDAKDRRIAELESALRTALAGWRTNHLCEVDYSDEELARIDELQKLVSSEET